MAGRTEFDVRATLLRTRSTAASSSGGTLETETSAAHKARNAWAAQVLAKKRESRARRSKAENESAQTVGEPWLEGKWFGSPSGSTPNGELRID